MTTKISVYPIIRPVLDSEIKSLGASKCRKYLNYLENKKGFLNRITVDDPKFNSRFTKCFKYDSDKIPEKDNPSLDIFNEIGDKYINHVMCGYNACVFAFGQTGSGKTFTLNGTEEREGLCQLMIRRIIERCSEASNVASITVMFVEDYNTDMYDLLATSKKSLPIHFDHNHGLQMRGVTKNTYSNLKDSNDSLVEEVLEMYRSSREKCVVDNTVMNNNSSRSHILIQITVNMFKQQMDKDEHGRDIMLTYEYKGNLCIIDLAGSEKIETKPGQSHLQVKQAISINTSLFNLTNLFSDIFKKQKIGIQKDELQEVNPTFFRSTNLTRYLYPYLFHCSRVAILLCCTPVLIHKKETIRTLQFGAVAMKVKTEFMKPIKSELDPTMPDPVIIDDDDEYDEDDESPTARKSMIQSPAQRRRSSIYMKKMAKIEVINNNRNNNVEEEEKEEEEQEVEEEEEHVIVNEEEVEMKNEQLEEFKRQYELEIEKLKKQNADMSKSMAIERKKSSNLMVLNKELNDKLQTQLLSPQMSSTNTHRVHFSFDDEDIVKPPQAPAAVPASPPKPIIQTKTIIKNVADHSQCNKVINNLKITVNNFLNKSKKLENNLKDKENEIKILEKKLESKNDEINQLNLIKSVTHSRENSNLSSGSSSGEIKTPDGHVQCNTKIKNLQKSISNYLNVIKKNENEINEKNKKIEELEKRNLNLEQTNNNNNINNNLTIIKNEEVVEADHSECNNRISELENEIENLKYQIENTKYNEDDNNNHDECNKKISDLQEQVESLKEENEEILRNFTSHTNENNNNNDNSYFEKKIQELSDDNNNIKLENERLLNEIKKLKSKGKDEKQAVYIRELEEKLRTITFQINTMKKRTKTVIIENGDINDQLKEKDDIIKALRNALNKHNLLIKSIPNNNLYANKAIVIKYEYDLEIMNKQCEYRNDQLKEVKEELEFYSSDDNNNPNNKQNIKQLNEDKQSIEEEIDEILEDIHGKKGQIQKINKEIEIEIASKKQQQQQQQQQQVNNGDERKSLRNIEVFSYLNYGDDDDESKKDLKILNDSLEEKKTDIVIFNEKLDILNKMLEDEDKKVRLLTNNVEFLNERRRLQFFMEEMTNEIRNSYNEIFRKNNKLKHDISLLEKEMKYRFTFDGDLYQNYHFLEIISLEDKKELKKYKESLSCVRNKLQLLRASFQYYQDKMIDMNELQKVVETTNVDEVKSSVLYESIINSKDYGNYNIGSYLNEEIPSLYTKRNLNDILHLARGYQYLEKDFIYDGELYWPSFYSHSKAVSSSDLNNLKQNVKVMNVVNKLIQLFMMILGFDLVIKPDGVVKCNRIGDKNELDKNVSKLKIFDYQYALNQIVYHLFEFGKESILKAIVDSIGEVLKNKELNLKSQSLEELYKNIWMPLSGEKYEILNENVSDESNNYNREDSNGRQDGREDEEGEEEESDDEEEML